MASLAELARQHTPIEGPHLAHLHRLVAAWGLLADLCFSDLLLLAPCRGSEISKVVVLAQVRPTTSQTLYRHDLVGTVFDEVDRPLVARSLRLGEIIEGEINLPVIQERVRVLSIPVRYEGKVIAVVTRESAPSIGRRLGELEQIYLEIFWRLASMIEHGLFPFPAQDAEPEEAPRVGDGVMLLDQEGRVEYASPNAVSALHRIGIHANAQGMRLSELGFEEGVVRTAMALSLPVTEEVERGPEVTVLLRCIPLLEPGRTTGALALLRDISELRRRDRLLISMDATIREIHHRVKNNLQTISALLGLQARRLTTREAKDAVRDTERRIRSIALVHEILSRETGDDVAYGEIARRLVRMVEEGLSSPERTIRFRVEGDPGMLPARIATPLSVVLTELLTNAVEHAFPADGGGAGGEVVLQMENDGEFLTVRVLDDGGGLPGDFELDATTGLGLSIVRTLVTTELQGKIEMGNRADGATGTVAELRVPAQLTHHMER